MTDGKTPLNPQPTRPHVRPDWGDMLNNGNLDALRFHVEARLMRPDSEDWRSIIQTPGDYLSKVFLSFLERPTFGEDWKKPLFFQAISDVCLNVASVAVKNRATYVPMDAYDDGLGRVFRAAEQTHIYATQDQRDRLRWGLLGLMACGFDTRIEDMWHLPSAQHWLLAQLLELLGKLRDDEEHTPTCRDHVLVGWANAGYGLIRTHFAVEGKEAEWSARLWTAIMDFLLMPLPIHTAQLCWRAQKNGSPELQHEAKRLQARIERETAGRVLGWETPQHTLVFMDYLQRRAEEDAAEEDAAREAAGTTAVVQVTETRPAPDVELVRFSATIRQEPTDGLSEAVDELFEPRADDPQETQ